ncbi:MAG: glycosyltransferase [Candidatus Shapirobacteria bacterium]
MNNDFFFKKHEELKLRRPELRARHGIKPEDTVLLFVGKLIEKKRPQDLLAAYKKLVVKNPNLKLVFVGDGALRPELEKEAAELPGVVFVGFKNQTELPEFYTLADVFVLPSGMGETWGLVVNEAMCFGLSVVASDLVGCGQDLVRDGETGFIFKFGNIEDLSEKILGLISNKKKINLLGEKSIEIANLYSHKKTVQEILNILDHIKPSRVIRFLVVFFGKIKLYLFFIPELFFYSIKDFLFRNKGSVYFNFNGEKLKYLRKIYNFSYRNERAVEIPIAEFLWKKYNPVSALEIGNVLSHYGWTGQVIIDKYEVAKNVLNIDAVDISTDKKYDLVVSVSTIEHIGWDWGEEKDFDKSIFVLNRVKKVLNPDGHMIITLPLGFNKYLDLFLKNNPDFFSETYFLKRISKDNKWTQCLYEEVKNCSYGEPFEAANAIMVGIFNN